MELYLTIRIMIFSVLVSKLYYNHIELDRKAQLTRWKKRPGAELVFSTFLLIFILVILLFLDISEKKVNRNQIHAEVNGM